MVWYDVCNDFTLEQRHFAPDVRGMECRESEAGTSYAEDFEEEGVIYYHGFENLDGFTLPEENY